MRYGKSDLLSYAPVTTKHAAVGRMTIEALCAAAIEFSDNTAANLLLASIGGPPAYTSFARGLGDTRTRLDRNEPALNTAIPGDPRDTTTPAAMARDLRAVVFGDVLSAGSRAHLGAWLDACATGSARLRAGLPGAWRIGDKTGTGDDGTANDVAVCRRPHASPVIVTAYLTGATVSSDARDAVLARVGRVVGEAFG